MVRFNWRNQWRNSCELYRARARSTQTIGLSGGHTDLSCPGVLFVQFAWFRILLLNCISTVGTYKHGGHDVTPEVEVEKSKAQMYVRQ